jgi:hypothetical protein
MLLLFYLALVVAGAITMGAAIVGIVWLGKRLEHSNHRPFAFLLLLAWGAVLLLVAYALSIDLQDKISLSLSATALAGSLFGIGYAIRRRPDVQFVGGTYPVDIHAGDHLRIAFYNSGDLPARVVVLSMTANTAELSVEATDPGPTLFDPRTYLHVESLLKTASGDDVISELHVVVTVKYAFWKGKAREEREGNLSVKVVPLDA